MWREKDNLLRTIPGVGKQLSLTVLAYLLELGTLDRKQTAALAGVAPSTGTVASGGVNAPSGAGVPGCEVLSIWEHWPQPATTLTCPRKLVQEEC